MGRAVTDDLLAPGWTPYGKRTPRRDVRRHRPAARRRERHRRGPRRWLVPRPAGLGARDGSQHVRLGARPARPAGADARGRDDVDRRDRWRRGRRRPARSARADLYDGCDIDLRLDASRLGSPGVRRQRLASRSRSSRSTARVIEPRVAPPVRVVADAPVRDRTARTEVAAGGSMRARTSTGWVRLRVRGSAGDTVTVRHAEVLEPDGSLHTRSLRSARATDTYVLAEQRPRSSSNRLHLPRLPLRRGRGRRRAARRLGRRHQLGRRRRAASSPAADPLLERLHENVVWSLRDNFVSVPTDCPQRDERLGWTGDAQAFAPTASLLVDSQAFWSSWLRDLALEQDPVLGVPTVVPDVVVSGEPRFGRAGWSDAATIVPWAVYEAYGDPEILRAQLRQHARPRRLARRPARVGRPPAGGDAVRRLARP